MSLLEPQRGRDIKLEIFEELTSIALQAALEEWLEARLEETIIGLTFESDGSASYIAYVLYTE